MSLEIIANNLSQYSSEDEFINQSESDSNNFSEHVFICFANGIDEVRNQYRKSHQKLIELCSSQDKSPKPKL
jgi:hypothetical protein